MRIPRFERKTPLDRTSITVTLLLFGYFWIFTTDYFALQGILIESSHFEMNLVKGFIFVTVASAGLYILLYLRDKQLEQSQRFSESILKTIDVGIVVCNDDGVLVQVNDYFVNMMGLKKHGILGRSITSVLPGEEHSKILDLFSSALESTPHENSIEWNFTDPEARNRTVVVNASLMTSPDGEKFIIMSLTDISEQKRMQLRLQESLDEQRVLLSEIHHRVKNNLAVISGMMQLQLFNETDERLKERLMSSIMRIQTMGSIHEVLYQSHSFSQVELEKAVEKLTKTALASTDKTTVDVSKKLQNVTLNINQAIPFAMIFSEVLKNSLHHAFGDLSKGTIEIELSGNEGTVSLQISDNGTRLPEDLEQLEKEESLGFQIIEILAKQLHGEFNYQSVDGSSYFSLQFEKAEVKGTGNAQL